MKNVSITFVVLLLMWLLLNNSLHPQILITGVVVSLVVSIIVCRNCDLFAEMKLSPKAMAYTLAFIGVFFIELIKSNLDVTRRVLNPKLPINPGIVEVKTTLKSKFARMVLANAITLTPGTLTVEVSGESFFIHWIDVQDEDIDAASNTIVKTFEKYLEVIYG